MSLRSPLGKVLGRGSAGEGVGHWWVQRVTAVALLPLTVWFAWSILGLKLQSYDEVRGWLGQPWVAVLTILLVLTMLLSFTGYLLPWDQLAIWAITVGSNMAKATPLVGAGGPFSKIMMFPGTDVPMIHAGSDARFFLLAGTFVGENALLRFYVLHCVFLPVIVTVLIAVHFWRIRKDGGISGPL